MISAVGVIKFLYKNKREWKGNRLELLESFFRAYFGRLTYTYFKRWESLIDYLDNVILFYFDRDDVLGQDGLKKLREWYRIEKERRQKKYYKKHFRINTTNTNQEGYTVKVGLGRFA